MADDPITPEASYIPELDVSPLRIQPRYDLGGPKPDTTAAPAAPAEGVSRVRADQLEEIAEDMLDIVARLGKLERHSGEIAAALEGVRTALAEQSGFHRVGLDALRAELAADRKALAYRFLFEPVVNALDSLERMLQPLGPAKDQLAYGQLKSAAATLSNLIQAIGFTRFDVTPGEEFDPARMLCLGYERGKRGVALRVLRPGYRVGGEVVREAGVLIADPLDDSEGGNSGGGDSNA